MSIGSFSVKNPVLVNILMITVLFLGSLSIIRLPQEQFSEVPFYFVNILVPYPGVSAGDVEESVSIPLENELQGISNLKRVTSVSSEGLSLVRAEFEDGISDSEFSILYQEVQTRVNGLGLPDGTLDPLVDDFSSADFTPVIEVLVSGDVDYGLLSAAALDLQQQIEKNQNISAADLIGYREKQILVEARRENLEALGMTLEEIVRAIQTQNVSVPGGVLKTNESRDFLIRTLGQIEESDELRSFIIRRGSGDTDVVYVHNVASVREGFDPDGVIARFNGRDTIGLRVTKVPGASSTDVIERVKKAVDQGRFPEGISVTLFNDSTVQIRDSIDVLVSNAVFGLILLATILFFFVGLRNALMTAIGIPITFALTFMVLEYLGETINSNTLFGLVLVLGLIVDHAIVIIENSFRQESLGLSRHDAAIKGADQVVWPVIAATATTVAAFLPLMILPGTIGKFLRVIPLTVSIALIVSTIEALFFLPSHYADWGFKKKSTQKEHGAWFNGVEQAYGKAIRVLYQHRGKLVGGLFVIMIGGFMLTNMLQQDLFSAEDFTYFTIDITMPEDSSLEKTNKVVAEYEKVILARLGDGEVSGVRSSVGFKAGSNSNTTQPNIAQLIVDLNEQKEGRKRPITVIMNEVRDETKSISGPNDVQFSKAVNGPPVSEPLSFRVRGDRLDDLETSLTAIKARLSENPNIFNIQDTLTPGRPEVRIRVNIERASAYGLSTFEIGQYIRNQFDGIEAASFFQDNREIKILVRFEDVFTDSVLGLRLMQFSLPDGRKIPFSSIADIDQDDSLSSIRRVDGFRELSVTASAYDESQLKDINADIDGFFKSELEPVYTDQKLIIGGEFAELANLLFEIGRVFLLGIFLIYLILGTQFKSYSQPLLILLSVPFAFVGVILYLFMSGTPFSTTVLYAGVALAGIAVNDAIVLISFINEQREEGMSVQDAVIAAARTRLRPILLTSLTTIAGLLPTAIGIGGVSVVWGPMASTIIFGLVFSTMTAVLFIPLFYGLLFDRKSKSRNELEGVKNA